MKIDIIEIFVRVDNKSMGKIGFWIRSPRTGKWIMVQNIGDKINNIVSRLCDIEQLKDNEDIKITRGNIDLSMEEIFLLYENNKYVSMVRSKEITEQVMKVMVHKTSWIA